MKLRALVWTSLLLDCSVAMLDLVPLHMMRPGVASQSGGVLSLLAKPKGGGGIEVRKIWNSDPKDQERRTQPQEVLHYGDTACPCIGFDNIEGTITVSYDQDRPQASKVQYPADLGSRCEKWEDGRHPDCMPGGNPGPGKGWCSQAWCLVDPCNCHTPVRPEPFKRVPDLLYRGRQVHYSYATCSSEEALEDVLPKIGDDRCRCVGFSDLPGDTAVTWQDPETGVNDTVQYSAELGSSCEAWEYEKHPMCRGDGPNKPDWCEKRWCFVDPCECNLPTPPKVTMYLPWATFTGKSLYYSYETCGNPDSFTKALNLKACVNQKSQEKCVGLRVRNGVQKCAWTGAKCLGAELVHHPLCAHLQKGEEAEYEEAEYLKAPSFSFGKRAPSQARSSSPSSSPLLLGAMLLLGLAHVS